jgi:hypothetical protein
VGGQDHISPLVGKDRTFTQVGQDRTFGNVWSLPTCTWGNMRSWPPTGNVRSCGYVVFCAVLTHLKECAVLTYLRKCASLPTCTWRKGKDRKFTR